MTANTLLAIVGVIGLALFFYGRHQSKIEAVKFAARTAYWNAQLAFPGELLDNIYAANPDRNCDNMGRRIQKIGEELGELNEAHLNVTSVNNPKGKTWPEVREEAIDTAIVALDVALTPHPGEVVTERELKEMVMCVLRTKLAKWAKNRSTAMASTQTAEDDV